MSDERIAAAAKATDQHDTIVQALDAVKQLPARLHAEGGALVMLAAINANLSRIADALEAITNSDEGYVRTRAFKYDHE